MGFNSGFKGLTSIQCAWVVLSSVACSFRPYFSTLFHKQPDFPENVIEHKRVFRFSLQLWSETFLILRRIRRDMIKNVYWSSCKVPVILFRLWWNLNFLGKFSKNIHIPNFIKIRPVGAELFHADGRTDRHEEANSRFPQFRKRV